MLASTATKAKQINSQQLAWKAAHRMEHHGKTLADFGMGLIRPSLEEARSKRVSLSTATFEPPAAFVTSDNRDGEQECRAYDIQDQGGCGSCYAFAAATAYSARMCLKTNKKWNLQASPQEMMDCSNGCDGGHERNIDERIHR